MRKQHALHARDHLPNGADPIPGGDHCWMQRAADMTFPSGTEILIDDYETVGGIPRSSLEADPVAGVIYFLKVGHYLITGGGATHTAATPREVQLVMGAGEWIPSVTGIRTDTDFSETPGVAAIGGFAATTSMFILSLDEDPIQNYVGMRFAQASGVDRNVTRASIVVQRIL